MRILKLLHQESGYFVYLFVLFGLSSGILHAAIIPFISYVSGSYDKANPGNINLTIVLVYLGLIVLMILSQRTFARFMTRLTQKIIFRTRLSILDSIRKANYYQYELIGKEEIYTAITSDANIVSNSAATLVYSTTSLITIVICLSYLAYLSLIGFGATILTMCIGISFYLIRKKRINKIFTDVRTTETTFFKHINELLSGFKEIKVDQKKNDEIYKEHIEGISLKSRILMTKGINAYIDNGLVGQSSFLLLIGFVLFVFPVIGIPTSHIFSYVFVILYIMGPIEFVMNMIPGLAQASISLKAIENIKLKSEEIKEEINLSDEELQFEKLEFQEVSFSYASENDEHFEIGPVNLTVNRGETIFIIGGNGSGKTTFFKLLTGLYTPEKGQILVNDEKTNLPDYRNLFSPIFSDFHLFERIYGKDKLIPENEVHELITEMQLENKVSFHENEFSGISLSTGQRKRLALISALIDDKPVLVLDEWAADQDPQFRKFFYEVLLKKFKDKGYTIIAITHDDKYFHVADQVYKMEEGRLSKVSH